ncbi:predicted protein [Streptomyces iranensis]|uniref:Uncharacterized protein n=1 Tax=Streptomyces iranensis TaxID=576784 RepID=A0A061AAF4_9ACTN|nr:predicted protein [Streptomyces iranensis]
MVLARFGGPAGRRGGRVMLVPAEPGTPQS